MSEWPEVELGNVAKLSWGDTSLTKESYTTFGWVAYSASGPDGLLPYFDHDAEAVVISAIGAHCGKTWLASGRWSSIKNTMWLKAAAPLAHTGFLYHLTKLSGFWPRRGAAQPFISLGDAKKIVIGLPPLETQRRIAAVLSAFDELIEINKRRIELLEDLARSLYREWFVHFRFPGHEEVDFVDSELGPIPEGWGVRTLGDVASNLDRRRKPLSRARRAERPGAYPYYGAAKLIDHIDDWLFDGEYLLFAEDGSVQTRAGYPMLQLVQNKFWANNHTHILEGEAVSTQYLYLAVSRLPIAGYVTGAAQPKITQANLNRIPVLVGPSAVHAEFDRVVSALFDDRYAALTASAAFATTRDLLLPRLVTGRLDISDVDLGDLLPAEAQ